MEVRMWGVRGSLPAPGPDTARYGGNTSCVSIRGPEGTVLVLDAGTGIRRMAASIDAAVRRVDVLLTHLHLDHIQGLGFFAPLYRPDFEVHIWGPASIQHHLRARLMRYLSPPLFPVRLGELPCNLVLHEVPCGQVDVGEFRVNTALVCHPGPTVGYRVTGPRGHVLTYLPDHEPALGSRPFPSLPREWTSGAVLAYQSDLLIHDSQYTSHEYGQRVGWGHSSLRHVLDFGTLADVKALVPFHHDPDHADEELDHLIAQAVADANPSYDVTAAQEGMSFTL